MFHFVILGRSQSGGAKAGKRPSCPLYLPLWPRFPPHVLSSQLHLEALPASFAKTLGVFSSFGLLTPMFLRRNCLYIRMTPPPPPTSIVKITIDHPASQHSPANPVHFSFFISKAATIRPPKGLLALLGSLLCLYHTVGDHSMISGLTEWLSVVGTSGLLLISSYL